MRFRSLIAIIAALTAGCGSSERRFLTGHDAVIHLKSNLPAYQRLAREWRAEGQRELCREQRSGFVWNDIAVSGRMLGWRVQRASNTAGELIDFKTLDDVAGVLGTTTGRVNGFLRQMEALDVACLSNIGVTLGDREGSYVQMQLSPFAEMYGFRYGPPEDAVAALGLRWWSDQPADAHQRRVINAGDGWYYFEGLVRTAALPLSKLKGTLRNSAGAPMVGVRLLLARAREDGTLDWAGQTVTDSGGRFTIVQIPAGSYLLGLNLFAWTTTDAPFPRTYFPGVQLRQEATPITLGEGRELDLGDFRVPYRVGNRRVVAEVRWSTGEPEPRAQADLCWDDADGRRCASMKPVDGSSGLFAFDAADDVPYHVTARYQPSASLFSKPAVADPVRVPLVSINGPLRLVLK